MPVNNAPIQEPVVSSGGFANKIWTLWFGSIVRLLGSIRNDGSIQPASLADADAQNNSIYYSTTQSRLVFKDSGGVVNNLY